MILSRLLLISVALLTATLVVAEDKPTLQEHLGQMAQAQRIAQPPDAAI